MEHNNNFKIGDKVVAYSCEKCAKMMRYRSAYFFGVIESIKDNIATVRMEDGHKEYKEILCIRHQEEVLNHLKDLWLELENVCIDDDDCIETDFHIWEAGTDRQEIWHWFDEQCPDGIADLIGTIEDYNTDLSPDYVRCNNCMTRMLVPTGVDKCPHCGEVGFLNDLDAPIERIGIRLRIESMKLPDGYDPLND